MDHSKFISNFCLKMSLIKDCNKVTIACCYDAQSIFDAIVNALATGNDILISYDDNYDVRLSNSKGNEFDFFDDDYSKFGLKPVQFD